MKKRIFIISILLAIGPFIINANAGSSYDIYKATLIEPNEKTPNISTDELQRILEEKSATVFDARSPKEYAIDHIPGVVNVRGKPGGPKAGTGYVSDVDAIGRHVGYDKAASIVVYCSGAIWGKSRLLAAELLAEGYKNVKRYQLGIPVWRVLNGVTEVELEGIAYAVERGSILIDARDPKEFMASSIPGARNIPLGDVKEAGKDGRLPVEDHNARIIIFGRDGEQARAVCEALTKSAFHNTSFYGGTFETLSAEFK